MSVRPKDPGPYQLADYHPASRKFRLVAVWTGERRCPKQGEWYLSGAIAAAWRAPNDLSSEYFIARVEKVVDTKLITEPLSVEEELGR